MTVYEKLLQERIDYALETNNKELFNKLTGEQQYGISYVQRSYMYVDLLIEETTKEMGKLK